MKKRNLLKFALLTLAALPMGAWAQETISNTTLWTFDQFYPNETITNDGTVFNYKGLYINSHRAGTNPDYTYTNVKAQKDASSAQTLNGSNTISTMMSLRLAGAQNTSLSADRTASTYTYDAVAFKAAVAGTVYVCLKSTYTSYKVNIYVAGTKNQTDITGNIQVVSQAVTAGANVFISTSSGGWDLYAVKFVPTTIDATETKNITMSDTGVMTFSDNHAWTTPAGLTAYYIKAATVTNGKPQIGEISMIPASQGVILQGTPNAVYTLTIGDRSQLSPDFNRYLRPVHKDYTLQQTYSTGSNDNQKWDNYILAKVAGNMVLAKSSGSGNIAAGKAYFTIRRDLASYPSPGANFLTLDFEEETTGIDAIINPETKEKNVFNLNGQRVNRLSKGLYIVNGKKVIIK